MRCDAMILRNAFATAPHYFNTINYFGRGAFWVVLSSLCFLFLRSGDLIMTYKMLTGKVKLDPEHFFERSQEERTRGHHLRLTKKRARLHARGNFFSHRVVSPWNALPEEVVLAATTNCFKNRLDHWQGWQVVAKVVFTTGFNR